MGVQPIEASFVASPMATPFESCERTSASDMDESGGADDEFDDEHDGPEMDEEGEANAQLASVDGDGMGVQPIEASFVASPMATPFESCERTSASDIAFQHFHKSVELPERRLRALGVSNVSSATSAA
jgi:hypothetical protein